MAIGNVLSRKTTVPVGVPVVVLAVWVEKVTGWPKVRLVADGVKVMTVGAEVMVRLRAALWAGAWVRSPEYVAVRVWGPVVRLAVLKVAELVESGVVARVVLFSRKVMLPVAGVPAARAAVRVPLP